jgi:SOS-response transcriptional repressor LexA
MNRPTKKQYELLQFIDTFVREHGFGPSYRDIMRGCNYNSVATVALHVNNLIKRGLLKKNGRSARSLEIVKEALQQADSEPLKLPTSAVKPGEEKWLVEKIDYQFKRCESSEGIEQHQIDSLYVLVGALKVLQLDGAANSFMSRLSELKKKTM